MSTNGGDWVCQIQGMNTEKRKALCLVEFDTMSTNLSLPLSVEAVHLLLDSAQQLCSILQIIIVSDSNL